MIAPKQAVADVPGTLHYHDRELPPNVLEQHYALCGKCLITVEIVGLTGETTDKYELERMLLGLQVSQCAVLRHLEHEHSDIARERFNIRRPSAENSLMAYLKSARLLG